MSHVRFVWFSQNPSKRTHAFSSGYCLPYFFQLVLSIGLVLRQPFHLLSRFGLSLICWGVGVEVGGVFWLSSYVIIWILLIAWFMRRFLFCFFVVGSVLVVELLLLVFAAL